MVSIHRTHRPKCWVRLIPLSSPAVKLETQNPSMSRGVIPAPSTSDFSARPIHHCALSIE
jgi:hypothetical protein